jgi:hypothetical protein
MWVICLAPVLSCPWLFLVEQGQQHLVPILVALGIALALGYQVPIEIDVCVVYVIQHWRPPHAGSTLSRRKGLACSILITRPVFPIRKCRGGFRRVNLMLARIGVMGALHPGEPVQDGTRPIGIRA